MPCSAAWIWFTANLRTNIRDFRGFDSSTILILKGEIPRPKGNFPESLTQASLVGIMLIERLGVLIHSFRADLHSCVTCPCALRIGTTRLNHFSETIVGENIFKSPDELCLWAREQLCEHAKRTALECLQVREWRYTNPDPHPQRFSEYYG